MCVYYTNLTNRVGFHHHKTNKKKRKIEKTSKKRENRRPLERRLFNAFNLSFTFTFLIDVLVAKKGASVSLEGRSPYYIHTSQHGVTE